MTFTDIALHVPDILLPSPSVDLTAWSVVACDQYTSQPEYWRRAARRVGRRPSALKLILPEAFLGAADCDKRIAAITRAMRQYVAQGVLSHHGPGFVRVERRTSRGTIRRGLVAALDLDAYDFRARATSLIRASEETVPERLPPRAAIRRLALVEVPHVMVLIDDPDMTVIEPLFRDRLPLLYDFDLMEHAGHLRGALVSDEAAIRRVARALRALGAPAAQRARYGVAGSRGALYAAGDGNHSLATAKVVWESTRRRIRAPAARAAHPARYALVELVNIHDPGLTFEPIHRLVRSVDADALLARMKAYCEARGSRCSHRFFASRQALGQYLRRAARRPGQRIPFVAVRSHGVLEIDKPRHALPAATLQAFLDVRRDSESGLDIDYIHGDETLRTLAARERALGFLLPTIAKRDLFRTVVLDGALPRKTFSMGSADEKRFYLECRRIVP